MIRRLFTQHPHEAGQTYLEHQVFAFSVGMKLLGAGTAAMAHAVFPFLFVTTAGKTIAALHDKVHRREAGAPQPGGMGVVP